MDNNHDEKLLDHNYDGIQELDNPLPRWWVYLFYVTIVFAAVYCTYYWFGYGDSLAVQHEKALKAMTPQQHSTETLSFDLSDINLEEGQLLFQSKCAPCHKPDGGGLVGPNLTDSYWIHGEGRSEDIYTVISEGVPEKGMLSWKSLLKPSEIKSIVGYIHAIKGSNPANAKAPEGTLYE